MKESTGIILKEIIKEFGILIVIVGIWIALGIFTVNLYPLNIIKEYFYEYKLKSPYDIIAIVSFIMLSVIILFKFLIFILLLVKKIILPIFMALIYIFYPIVCIRSIFKDKNESEKNTLEWLLLNSEQNPIELFVYKKTLEKLEQKRIIENTANAPYIVEKYIPVIKKQIAKSNRKSKL